MNSTKYIYITFTTLVVLWCVGIIAAPVLKQMDNGKSLLLYEFYSKVCHQKDDHSFHIGNDKFGVCIRCASIYFGFCIGLLLIPFFVSPKKKFLSDHRLLFIILIPMLIDVLLNFLNIVPSSSKSRIFSGLIFGLAASWFIFPLISDALSKIIKRNWSK